MTNSLDAAESLLGSYLKARRAKLDPAAFGFTSSRRRTPGLRREEVAARANVSATWYTWLEQGRREAIMKHFLLFYDVSADYLQRRGEFRETHLRKAWASHAAGELVLG